MKLTLITPYEPAPTTEPPRTDIAFVNYFAECADDDTSTPDTMP
ncbi:hypothetical protein [Nocardia asteroides]|nr:hypothetical protein [Nocardia asteroides]SFN82074.1 hypothetical protein SAMN05444423_11529 [Nocardia asteroides]VEG36407.1 Uncharacterised protein [Nocardia asteroides]